MKAGKSLDVGALREKWLRAEPFSHVVIDDFLTPETLLELCQAVAEEPHWPLVDEIATTMASNATMQHGRLRAFESAMGEALAGQVAVVAGLEHEGDACALGELMLRSYVYMPGHALLPHSDWREGVERVIAVVLYLHADGCEGGALSLYYISKNDDVLSVGGGPEQVVGASIEAKAGRLVLFEVSKRSLHRVEEVRAGARVSLAGWFYAPGVDPRKSPDAPPPEPFFHVHRPPSRIGAEIVAALRNCALVGRWIEVADVTRGRFEYAELDVGAAVVAAIGGKAEALVGRRLRVLSARLQRFWAGGYALAKDAAARRPADASFDVIVDASEAALEEGGELVWQGAHGMLKSLAVAPGAWAAVERGADVGCYVRRLAGSAGSAGGVSVLRLIVHATAV